MRRAAVAAPDNISLTLAGSVTKSFFSGDFITFFWNLTRATL
jgi:hypothetical protein